MFLTECTSKSSKIRIFFYTAGRLYHNITNWYESEIINDRKSRFQARHVELRDSSCIPEILEQFLKQNKNIAKSASHPHIIAWRTGVVMKVASPSEPKLNKKKLGKARKDEPVEEIIYTNIKQGFKDNGEKGAGTKLLEQVLVHHNLLNILVIVTRWYGGTPIGSSRFRHILHCSLNSLRKGNKL